MRRFGCLLLMLLLLPLAGCQAKEVNNTSAALGIGADLEGEQIKISIQMAKPVPPEKSGKELPFITASGLGRTASEATRNISLSIPRQTLWSHASILFLGDTLAQRDLSLIADILARNTDIRKSARIFVARGNTAEEIMSSQTPLEPYSSLGIRDLVRTQEKQLGIYTTVSLGEFIFALSTAGIDPLLPQVSLVRQGDRVLPTLNGTAAFKGKKMVGSLDKDETQGYRWMKTGLAQGGIIIIPSPIDPRQQVTLEVIRSRGQSRAVIKGDEIRIKLEINAEGNFYEQDSAGPVLTAENVKKMEELASREIARQCNASIARAQSLNSDIFGWGRAVDIASPHTWEQVKSDWYEIFPRVQADVKVKFSIRRTYLTADSFVFR
ncbi:Ger(x)C family spore germination protein [Syntrophomonas curvata]